MKNLQKTGIALLGIVLSIGLVETTQAQNYGDAGVIRFSPIMPNPGRSDSSSSTDSTELGTAIFNGIVLGVYRGALNDGRSRFEQGDFSGAISPLSRVIDMQATPEAYILRGISKSYSCDRQGAVEDLTQAISLVDNPAQIYATRGGVHYTQGDLSAAIADQTRAISLAPELIGSYLSRGIARAKLQDYQGALEDLNWVIQTNSNLTAAGYSVRGDVLYAQGDVEAAMRDWRAAAAGNFPEGMRDNDGNKVTSSQLAADARFSLALALYGKGDRREGLKLAEEAIRTYPRLGDWEFLKRNIWHEQLLKFAESLLKEPRIHAARLGTASRETKYRSCIFSH